MSDSEIRINVNANTSKAVAGIGATAAAVDTLKIAMTGLQKAMFLLAIVNQLVQLFSKLGEAADWAGEAIKRMVGVETTTDKLHRMRLSVDQLADSYKQLSASVADANTEMKNSRAYEDQSAVSGVARAQSKVDVRLADALLSETDPQAREVLTAAAKSEKDRIAYVAQDRQSSVALSRINSDEANNQALYDDFANMLAQVQSDEAAAGKQAQSNSGLYESNREKEEKKKASELQRESAAMAARIIEQMKALDVEAGELARRRTLVESGRVTTGIIEAARRTTERVSEDDRARAREKADVDSWTALSEANAADARKRNRAAVDGLHAQQAKRDAVTVDAPITASAGAAIGGITGGTVNNAARMREQRELALQAIAKEQVDLLSKIEGHLVE
jgi:hypothetical protein